MELAVFSHEETETATAARLSSRQAGTVALSEWSVADVKRALVRTAWLQVKGAWSQDGCERRAVLRVQEQSW